MIPNNNLSILPWYSSIEQQNARKWWVYNRVYPLFAPAAFLLPFQIMREHRPLIVKGAALESTEYDGGILTPAGEWVDDSAFGVSEYEIAETVKAIYFENVSKPIAPYVAMVAYDAEMNMLGTYTPDFQSGTTVVSGGWILPANTSTVRVQTYDANTEIYATVYAATIEPVAPVSLFELYTYDGQLVRTMDPLTMGFDIKPFEDLGYDVIVYPGNLPIFSGLLNGQYYAKLNDGQKDWFSEVFTVVNDIEPYLKIVWWDVEDFTMDAGTIVYRYFGGAQFRNVLYLQADIAKPEYLFEEEGETRDGYFFPVKQISEKRYKFSFLSSEYLLDVMRFIRMADYAYIEKNGQRYNLDTFLMTPEWEKNGDVASVDAMFDTATVAKKIGRGYLPSAGGDFNNDFNNDYNNQE